MFFNRRFTEEVHPVNAVAPVANAFAGTVTSQPVKMALWAKFVAMILKGVGATGTATITVEACADAIGTNPVAIPFTYRSYVGANDVPTTDPTLATAAGFVTTAGSNQVYVIEADRPAMLASGNSYLRVKSIELVANPVTGCIVQMLCNPNFQGVRAPASVIV